MRSRRFAYLPLASIVVGIVILAIAVGTVSFRDIEKGRRQVAEVLERQGAAVVRFLSADVHSELFGPGWQRGRLDLFFEQIGIRREVAYVALLDSEGSVLAHSDRELVGSEWPADLMPDFGEPPRRAAHDFGPPLRRSVGEFVNAGGFRVYQFAGAIEITPSALAERIPGRRVRSPILRLRPDPPTVVYRLSDLLQRPVGPEETVRLIAIAAFDASELEAAFLVSRNHTLLMASLLLIVGGVAIYFLFVLAGYRSAQTALVNMRSYTTNVIESMASGLVSVDAAGRVVTINSRARSLIGLAGSEAPQGRLSDVVTITPRSVSVAVDEVVAGERDVVEAEAELSVDGEPLPVALSVSSLLDEDGRRSGSVILFQDLREVEALKAEVERARHLATIGRLAAGVAHEVRNPLSSLKGFAQFLKSRFESGSDEERYSDIMIEEVERLDRVVQELLDFAKPVTPITKPVEPNALVDEALALVSEDAGFRNVSIVRRFATDLPSVLVDQFQIRQALLNIFLNAIEAMGGGGTMTVETDLSSESGHRSFAVISVSDTGPGLAVDELGKLFEPFYTTKQKGTGLGLTIVSRLIEQNGGAVTVTSAIGEGTTFALRLPFAGAGGDGGRRSAATGARGVQDDAVTREGGGESQ